MLSPLYKATNNFVEINVVQTAYTKVHAPTAKTKPRQLVIKFIKNCTVSQYQAWPVAPQISLLKKS